MDKKSWHAPSLVVLVRGRPEETVMDTCKGSPHTGGTGPETANPGCYKETACIHCLFLQTS